MRETGRETRRERDKRERVGEGGRQAGRQGSRPPVPVIIVLARLLTHLRGRQGWHRLLL